MANHMRAYYCGIVMLATLRHKSSTRFLYGAQPEWFMYVSVNKLMARVPGRKNIRSQKNRKNYATNNIWFILE